MPVNKAVRKPAGHLINSDGNEMADTSQCCHCGQHFVIVKGSGKRRGFCMNCGDVTCGSRECHQCLHFLKKIELYEEGKLKSLR